MIGYAIDARAKFYPEEAGYTYQPHVRSGEQYRWDENGRDKIAGYYAYDLNI